MSYSSYSYTQALQNRVGELEGVVENILSFFDASTFPATLTTEVDEEEKTITLSDDLSNALTEADNLLAAVLYEEDYDADE